MCAREADPKGAQAALLGIYTLTPTHCGTGKAGCPLPAGQGDGGRRGHHPAYSAICCAVSRQPAASSPTNISGASWTNSADSVWVCHCNATST